MKRNGSRAVFFPRGRIGGRSATNITAAGLAVVMGLTIGCGIETLPYLEPPAIGGTEPFPNLQHSTVNTIDEFVGYDFYYRFFRDRAAFEQNPVNTNITGESNLVSRGYRRMIARPKTDDHSPAGPILTPPILLIPDPLKNVPLDFEYELPDGILQDEPQILAPAAHAGTIPSLFLMRNVGTPASPEPLSFLEPFSGADQHDLSAVGLSNIASLDQITIALYVIAVGYDLESFAVIRSTPVFGGLTTFFPN